jgi:hypothetical protein
MNSLRSRNRLPQFRKDDWGKPGVGHSLINGKVPLRLHTAFGRSTPPYTSLPLPLFSSQIRATLLNRTPST